jgi:hypothetical protein
MMMLLATSMRHTAFGVLAAGPFPVAEPTGARAKKNARSRFSAAGHGHVKSPLDYRKPGRASLLQAASEEQR